MRKSRKFVGSSSISRLGSCSSSAASFTRVCQPPESDRTVWCSIASGSWNCHAISPQRQSGCPLSRIRKSSTVSPSMKRVVLPQVAEAQLLAADDVAGVEFLVAEQNAAERALAGAVAADEADFLIVGQCAVGAVEQLLVAVAFVGVLRENDGHEAKSGRMQVGKPSQLVGGGDQRHGRPVTSPTPHRSPPRLCSIPDTAARSQSPHRRRSWGRRRRAAAV